MKEYYFHYNHKMTHFSDGRDIKITVCAIETKDWVDIGVAICSEKDNYCKAKGRELAIKRAKDFRYAIFKPAYVKAIGGVTKLMKSIVRQIIDNSNSVKNIKKLIGQQTHE